MLAQGNQQVTSGWFCGILEGEGNFRLKQNYAVVRISNTDEDIIEKCEDFLRQNYISFTTSVYPRKRGKPEHVVTIAQKKSDLPFNYALMLYNLIEGKLQCRRNEYQQILGTSTTTRDATIDLDWLIGIYEAEGSFYVRIERNQYAQPRVIIVNTNQKIIEKIRLNLDYLNCTYHIKDMFGQEYNHKNYTIISIYGFKRCLKFLQATENYWLAWRNQKRTSLMKEFIESRLSMPQGSGYTQGEQMLIQSIKDFNSW